MSKHFVSDCLLGRTYKPANLKALSTLNVPVPHTGSLSDIEKRISDL